MDWRWRSWNANPRSSKSSSSIYHQIFNRGRHNNTANNNRSASHKKVLIQTADYNHHEYAIELLPWKYDWPARIKSFSKTQCCFPLVLCMFCLFHVFILLKCWHLAENMLLFPKIPLILWICYKQSTRCGRVHFEHSHRKWLVITVRPTTSVRESPRKNLPPRNTPDLFCRRFTRQNHRCAAWAVFFFTGAAPWKFHEPTGRDTDFSSTPLHKQGQELRSEQTATPLHEQHNFYLFLRLNNLEAFVENEFWAQR